MYITGKPYDTLHKVIGEPGDKTGSCRILGIKYSEVPLQEDGSLNWEQIAVELQRRPKMSAFNARAAMIGDRLLSIAEIEEMVKRVKEINRIFWSLWITATASLPN